MDIGTFQDFHSNYLEKLSGLILRFGLVASSLLCIGTATHLWNSGNMAIHTSPIVLSMLNYILGFSGLILAANIKIDENLTRLVFVMLMLVLVSRAFIHVLDINYSGTYAGTTDVLMYSEYAANLLLEGKNPYQTDFIDSLRVFRMSDIFTTPLIDGDFSTRLPYPSLSFLLFTPVVALGLPGSIVYPLFLIFTLVLLFWAAPKIIRPVILLPFFADPGFVNFSLGGVSDIVWAFFISLMIWKWDYKIMRGVLFGLAISYKQTPWFLWPFILIRLWKSTDGTPKTRIKEIFIFSGVSSFVFLLLNSAFILWDAEAWFLGNFEPVLAKMVYFGQGLSMLTTLGLVPIPKAVFTFLVILCLSLTLLLYYRHYNNFAEVMWIVPGMVLWFGYRSLPSYWYFWVFPFIFALFRESTKSVDTQLDAPKEGNPDKANISTALLIGFSIIVLFVVYVFNLQEPKVLIRVPPPYLTTNDMVSRLVVEVTNQSDSTLTPRFSIQSRVPQPFFWNINAGPLELSPGSTGTYQISTDVPFRAFNLKYGAMVVVSDTNRYDLRASYKINSEIAGRYYDGIPNGEYAFWDSSGEDVYFWNTLILPPQVGSVALDPMGEGVSFTISTTDSSEWNTVMLDTWINFPEEPLSIWVKPPELANNLETLNFVYGLEVISTQNGNRVWVLFGEERSQGELQPGLHYWMIPAPKNEWSEQVIDLRQVFSNLNLEISRPEREIRYFLDFPISMLNFRLLLGAKPGIALPQSATFGPIENQFIPDTQLLISDGLENPEQALIWRGDYNFMARNFEKAEAYYQDALDIVPVNPHARLGLAETYFWLGQYSQAIEQYNQVVGSGYKLANVYRGLGWSYFEIEEYSVAESSFLEAIKVDASLADAYNGLGWVFYEKGDCAQAIRFFDQALALNATLYDAQRGLDQCSP